MLKDHGVRIVKVDADKQFAILLRFQISTFPTLVRGAEGPRHATADRLSPHLPPPPRRPATHGLAQRGCFRLRVHTRVTRDE